MRYLLVDSGHLVGRCAAVAQQLMTTGGIPTGTVHAFLRGLSFVRNQQKVDYKQLVCCWDGGRSEYRKKLYPEYKSGRGPAEPTEDDIRRREEHYTQVGILRKMLGHLGCKQVWVKGVEADDIIGILATLYVDMGHDVIVYSGDYDFHQLVSPHVRILAPKDDTPKGERDIFFKWNVGSIEEILLTKAIIGDTSDAIKGVHGVGPKKCEQVLQYVKLVNKYDVEFNSLVNSEKERKILETCKASIDIIRRNLKLVTIPRTFEECPYSLEQQEEIMKQLLESSNFADRLQFLNALRELELNSILEQINLW